jgi:glycine/D-amino acid oxidase-like deaminating enzyme
LSVLPYLARRPLPRSLYAETARPAPPEDRLDADAQVSVAIVGGGFTGLSAALHLAEAGRDVLVLDIHEPGWGASGRNGGQVNPGLKHEPDAIEAQYGKDLGGRMIRMSGEAPGLVFSLVERHGIACEAWRGGTIRAAVAPGSEPEVRSSAEQWIARGAPLEILEAERCREMVGTSYYRFAYHDRRGGMVNPLGYARGLAEAAQKAGARVCSGSPALALTRDGSGWTIDTPRGRVKAGQVLVGTNGYTGPLVKGLQQTVVPVFSAITATEPLPATLLATIMPQRPVLYEISHRYAYYRIDANGRFLMGGRSIMHESDQPEDYAVLREHAVRLFPALKHVAWTHCWNGQVAITTDQYPHVHEPAPGLTIGLGYNGRGIAMATAMGKLLAERALGKPLEDLDLPVTPITPMPFHRFWKVGVTARMLVGDVRQRIAGG